jgi:soluble P-type ATPase
VPAASTEHRTEDRDQGATPLAVAEGKNVLGVVRLNDVVKGGIKERFERFRAMGIRTIMITGDNPRTAAAIAKEAGVDDFLAEATPEAKMRLIKTEQAKGKLVAMTGDGTNDAPALAQADVGVAMNTGTQAAKEAGNMIDLDSNPTKLLEVVEVGKQLLMTRGALTTFSIANDVAKYFAILPAMFMGAFPEIAPLNVMGLASPSSAILSAVIFNAIIIVLLIPLALARREIPAAGRGGALPALHADLWIGRHCRSLHRHQDRRPGAQGASSRLRYGIMKTFIVALRVTLVTLVLTGILYPLGMTALAQVLFPTAANGSCGPRRERKGRGLATTGSNICEARLLSAAPVRRGQWLRSHGFRGIELRANVGKAARSGESRDRSSAKGESRCPWQCSHGPCHGVGQWARSAHQSGRCHVAGSAGRASARGERGAHQCNRRRVGRRTRFWISWRANG